MFPFCSHSLLALFDFRSGYLNNDLIQHSLFQLRSLTTLLLWHSVSYAHYDTHSQFHLHSLNHPRSQLHSVRRWQWQLFSSHGQLATLRASGLQLAWHGFLWHWAEIFTVAFFHTMAFSLIQGYGHLTFHYYTVFLSVTPSVSSILRRSFRHSLLTPSVTPFSTLSSLIQPFKHSLLLIILSLLQLSTSCHSFHHSIFLCHSFTPFQYSISHSFDQFPALV
jgi:hypothetical protein